MQTFRDARTQRIDRRIINRNYGDIVLVKDGDLDKDVKFDTDNVDTTENASISFVVKPQGDVDLTVAINGNTVDDSNELRNTISMMQPGQTVKLTINRNGSTKDIDVKLGELPLSKEETANDTENGGSKESMKGITVETLDSDTAQQLQLPEATKGVVVTGVDPSSPAADSGLRKGDVIQEVNHQPVKNAAEFEAAMSKSEKSGALLLVNRGGTTVFVAL